jgi:ABC-type lipoprotein release transport system permease subunit
VQQGLIIVVMAMLASLIPAWQAANKEPAEALHYI